LELGFKNLEKILGIEEKKYKITKILRDSGKL
jgi:hypothetical protein